jgi:hypothetical protein
MKLSLPLPTYNSQQRASDNFQLEQADRANHKKDQDIEVGTANIILKSPNGTRYELSIDNSGNLSTAAI